jgi:hypothetical protein
MKEIVEQINKLGFDLFESKNQINEFNFNENNLLKAPYSKLPLKTKFNNSIEEIDFNNIDSYGVYLGKKDLIAIDIDGAIDNKVVKIICDNLNLPQNYNWIIKSGSQCGYHILLRCKIPDDLKSKESTSSFFLPSQIAKPFKFGELDTNAYYPKLRNYGLNHLFYKIEFKWNGNIILPPSLHLSGNNYKFQNEVPKNNPILVDFEKIESLQLLLSSCQAKSSEFNFTDEISNLSTETSYQLSYSDSLKYNFKSKFKEPSIVFHILQYPIHNAEKQPIFMNQISWFIIDNNQNVIKRKSYNYYTEIIRSNVYCKPIELNVSRKIVDSQRLIFHEFIFDLMHVEKIICNNEEIYNILKEEITTAELYHDAFLKKIIIGENLFENEIYDYNDQKKDKLKDRIYIQNQLVKYKSLKTNSNNNRIELNWITFLENKMNDINNLNSIFYLTTLYTIYITIKNQISNK